MALSKSKLNICFRKEIWKFDNKLGMVCYLVIPFSSIKRRAYECNFFCSLAHYQLKIISQMVNHCISVIFSLTRLKLHFFSLLKIKFIYFNYYKNFQCNSDLVSIKHIRKFSLFLVLRRKPFSTCYSSYLWISCQSITNLFISKIRIYKIPGFHKCTYIKACNRFIKTANFRLNKLFQGINNR